MFLFFHSKYSNAFSIFSLCCVCVCVVTFICFYICMLKRMKASIVLRKSNRLKKIFFGIFLNESGFAVNAGGRKAYRIDYYFSQWFLFHFFWWNCWNFIKWSDFSHLFVLFWIKHLISISSSIAKWKWDFEKHFTGRFFRIHNVIHYLCKNKYKLNVLCMSFFLSFCINYGCG